MRNCGVSQTMPFLVIARSLLGDASFKHGNTSYADWLSLRQLRGVVSEESSKCVACHVCRDLYAIHGSDSGFLLAVDTEFAFGINRAARRNMQDFWNTSYAVVASHPDGFFFTNLIRFPEGTLLYYHSFAYPMVFAIGVLSKFFGTECQHSSIFKTSAFSFPFPWLPSARSIWFGI